MVEGIEASCVLIDPNRVKLLGYKRLWQRYPQTGGTLAKLMYGL